MCCVFYLLVCCIGFKGERSARRFLVIYGKSDFDLLKALKCCTWIKLVVSEFVVESTELVCQI